MEGGQGHRSHSSGRDPVAGAQVECRSWPPQHRVGSELPRAPRPCRRSGASAAPRRPGDPGARGVPGGATEGRTARPRRLPPPALRPPPASGMLRASNARTRRPPAAAPAAAAQARMTGRSAASSRPTPRRWRSLPREGPEVGGKLCGRMAVAPCFGSHTRLRCFSDHAIEMKLRLWPSGAAGGPGDGEAKGEARGAGGAWPAAAARSEALRVNTGRARTVAPRVHAGVVRRRWSK